MSPCLFAFACGSPEPVLVDSGPDVGEPTSVLAPGPSAVSAPGSDPDPADTGEPVVDSGDTGVPEPDPRPLDVWALGALAHTPAELGAAAELGVRWVRPHPGPFAWEWFEPEPGAFDWSLTDSWVLDAEANLVGTLWPFAGWDQVTCQPASCSVGDEDVFLPRPGRSLSTVLPASRCAPCDADAWVEAVTALVERYDGDGVDDAPGLARPITVWEVLNEPELRSEELTFFFGEAEDYARLLQQTAAAVYEACPECSVLHGGSAGAEESVAFWSAVYQSAVGGAFDIANVHCVHGGDLSTLNVAPLVGQLDAAGLERPIWVTEAELPDDEDPIALIRRGLEAGASKVFVTDVEVAGAVIDALHHGP